jgi:hypothetical protein
MESISLGPRPLASLLDSTAIVYGGVIAGGYLNSFVRALHDQPSPRGTWRAR